MSQEQPFLQQVRDTSNTTLDVLLSNIATSIGVAYGAANTASSAAATALAVGQAAYAQANAAFAQANVGISIAESAYGQANTATSAAATALSVAEAAYTTANVGVSNSGVTAGTYGSGSAIPVFNVDSRGRVTAISTATYNLFTAGSDGIVPASGGGTLNFLRADRTWAPPLFATSQTLSANGNIQLAGGLVFQWGQFASSVNGGSAIQNNNFSLAFNNNCLFCTMVANGAVPIEVITFNRTTMTWAPSFGGGAAGAVSLVRYFAVGF